MAYAALETIQGSSLHAPFSVQSGFYLCRVRHESKYLLWLDSLMFLNLIRSCEPRSSMLLLVVVLVVVVVVLLLLLLKLC